MIRLYDFDFNIVFNISRFTSTRWNILYNGIGTFEAHFPSNSDVIDVIAENINPTQSKYLVVVDGDKSAIITGYQLQDDFVVYGRTCNWILSKRITKKFDTVSGPCDVLAREFVSTAFSDVDNFVLGDKLSLAENIEFSRDSDSLVSDVVTECLKLQNCGHTVDFDTSNKCWVYKSLCGKNLNLVLSEGNKNAYDINFTYDILDLADCGYYEKQTEQDGVKSTETAYLSTEGTKSGIYRWEALLNSKSEAEAQSELSRQSARSEASLKVRSAVFGKDYLLGDIVRVQIIKGAMRKTVKKRISAVEIQSRNGFEITQPVFEEV